LLVLLLGLLAVAPLACSSRARFGHVRLYSARSPFNVPIPASARVDPRSPAMVDQLVREVQDNGWTIASKAWTSAVYSADRRTPRRAVRLTSRSYRGWRLGSVPLPARARVPGDADGGVVVIDRSTGCEYDLGQARRTAAGWSARLANALPTGGSGVYPFAEAPSASGFASAAGMIFPEELAAGRIEHALAFAMENTRAGGFVAPATGSDGWSRAPGAIPEGARLQLDPTLDLDELGLEPWQKTIARALQRYGMLLADSSGAVALHSQHLQSATTRYWNDDGWLPASLARHMRVLATGRQRHTVYRFVENRCARLVRARHRGTGR
jgi:hypothetical protein